MGDAASGAQDATVEALARAAQAADSAGGAPVERWDPPYCGDIGMQIRADGSWWYQGSRIARPALVRLFARILRKDADGRTYLVTPAEKVLVDVECAPFLAVRVDRADTPHGPRLVFETNLGDLTEASAARPIRVETDPDTLEPRPFVLVRGRLEALMTRAVFFELAQWARPQETAEGTVLGVDAGGAFFPLGPAGIL